MPTAESSPLRPLLPFWGLDAAQADRAWVESGNGLEAILFRRAELEELDRFKQVLDTVRGEAPLTMHFPMDANHLEDSWVTDRLYRFLDIAAAQEAIGVVLHSNCLIDVDRLADVDLSMLRCRFLEHLASLDQRISGSGLWLGVENMPLVGDLGDDVDAVFVYPEDFAEFTFAHVGITLDTAHWVGTLDSTAAAQALDIPRRYLPPLREHAPLDFTTLRDKIRHLHLSAVTGVALPSGRSTARGGQVPGEGVSGAIYRGLLAAFAGSGLTVSLEVEEQDYRQRRAAWQALAWLRRQGLVA